MSACEVGGFLSGGFILLYCGPLAAAAALGLLQLLALSVGQVAFFALRYQAAMQTLPIIQPSNSDSASGFQSALAEQRLQHHPAHNATAATVADDPPSETDGSQRLADMVAECNPALSEGSRQQKQTQPLMSEAADEGRMSELTRLDIWADHAASPAAAAAIMIQSSLVDLGPLMLAFLVLRGVPAVLVAAAAAAAVPASAIGVSAALYLCRRLGLLRSGLCVSAAVVMATWAATAPLLAAPSFEEQHLAFADAVLVSSLAMLAVARAAFSTVTAFLLERWQEEDDAAEVATTQRQLSSASRVVVMIVALVLVSPRRLPWLLAASAVVTSVGAVAFAAFAIAEWSQDPLDDSIRDELAPDEPHNDADPKQALFTHVWDGPSAQLAIVSDRNSDSKALCSSGPMLMPSALAT